MAVTRIVLVDDERAASLGPLASTRAVFEIRCGLTDALTRWRSHDGYEVVGLRVRNELRDVVAERHPDLPLDPPGDAFDELVDGRRPGPDASPFERPWHVVDANAELIVRDFEAAARGHATPIPDTAAVIGPPDHVSIDPSATVHPFVVFDVTDGPIAVGSGAFIDSFTKIEGPAAIGDDAKLFRALIRPGTTIGPRCRVGGEIEASIFQGYSNKYHEGFVGHAFVGEWSNLGAGTTNSDLRNDYGEVLVPMSDDGRTVDKVATGTKKAGLYLGDHVKTAIGSLFNTGTTVGEGAVVAPGGGLCPKFLPPFSRLWHGKVDDGLDFEATLETARTAMARRERELSPAAESLLRRRHRETAELRATVAR